ncbi:MAG: hypothetical protein NUV50_01565 [Rhodospirillales bacterium]|nr:hypothetical protein [Rhodospirillales bacterium]
MDNKGGRFVAVMNVCRDRAGAVDRLGDGSASLRTARMATNLIACMFGGSNSTTSYAVFFESAPLKKRRCVEFTAESCHEMLWICRKSVVGQGFLKYY